MATETQFFNGLLGGSLEAGGTNDGARAPVRSILDLADGASSSRATRLHMATALGRGSEQCWRQSDASALQGEAVEGTGSAGGSNRIAGL